MWNINRLFRGKEVFLMLPFGHAAGGSRILAALFTTAIVGHAQAFPGVVVHVQPSAPVVNVGDTFLVTITADIEQSSAIVGFGMDLLFDPAVLDNSATEIALSPLFIPLPGTGGDGDGLGGLVVPPDPAVWGNSVVLATITLTAQSAGSSLLLGAMTVGDPLEGFVGVGGQSFEVTFVPLSVIVVPAPSIFVLYCMAIGVPRRRR